MIRRRAALASLAVAVLGAAVSLPSHASSPVGPAAEPAESLAALVGVNFISACGFSHRAPDDPIVYPRQPGRSHDHSFVGNRSTNAYSTLASLLRAPTTCHRPADTAAYWMPTLLVQGQPVAPRRAQIYYRRRTLAPVQAFPLGFRMIAGDAGATAPQPRRTTFWDCGAAGGVPPSATVPTCPDAGPRSLRLHVTFPDCWDGRSLDSADHQSHMAYSLRGRCPDSHRVAVPAISLIYAYPSAGGAGVELASGGQYSAHADFVNSWRQNELVALVEGCLNALRHCGRDS